MDTKQIQMMQKTGSNRMPKKTILLTPDQMGYQDRGKMKWQGLILSDHTEALKKKSLAEQTGNVLPKDQLPLKDIGEKLAYVYQKKLPICIQLNTLKNGASFQEYHCLVAGNYDNEIYFSLKNGQMIKTSLENIRHLELIDLVVWQMLE